MKVLLVNKFLYPNGGSETYMFEIGNYLLKKGHSVEYFGMDDDRRCVSNNVQSYTKNMNFHTGSKFAKLLYPIKTIYSSEARKKIKLVLDDFQPDVVHINNFNYQLTPSIILEIDKWRKEHKKDCKIIYTAHDYQLICPNHMLNIPSSGNNCTSCINGCYKKCIKNKCIHNSTIKSLIGSFEGFYWKRRKVYKKIDKIICCSNFVKNMLNQNDNLKDKTITLMNFVSDVKIPKVKKEDYILYFGRFSKEKGINTLINICKKNPNIKFVFAGSGPLSRELEKINNIECVGFKKGKELHELISKAKFSIVPSEWYEPFGLTIVESQILGTPVIGAKIGGIQEIIQHNNNGLLFESGNENDLEKCILNLYNNSKLLNELTENCKKNEYETIDKYFDKLMKVYLGEENKILK